jgi:hypothetical protein
MYADEPPEPVAEMLAKLNRYVEFNGDNEFNVRVKPELILKTIVYCPLAIAFENAYALIVVFASIFVFVVP